MLWKRKPLKNAYLGPLAQSVEQRTFNPWVVGSIPTGPTKRPHLDFMRGDHSLIAMAARSPESPEP